MTTEPLEITPRIEQVICELSRDDLICTGTEREIFTLRCVGLVGDGDALTPAGRIVAGYIEQKRARAHYPLPADPGV